MAKYFNIIIPFKKFTAELHELMIKYEIQLYAEMWNEKEKFYYKVVDFQGDLAFTTDHEYHGFFFSSKLVEVENGKLISGKNKKDSLSNEISFYDDNLFNYCIEGEGGREDADNLEIIKLRIISKKPDQKIEKFYNAFQSKLKKNIEIGRGLWLGDYFDKNVYFYKTTKNRLPDFDNKEYKYLIK